MIDMAGSGIINSGSQQGTQPTLMQAAVTLGLMAVLLYAKKQVPRGASGPTRIKAHSIAVVSEDNVPRPAQSWTNVAKRTWSSLNQDRILSVAAGITFYGLLAIFPALAAFLALYGLVADYSAIQSHLATLSGVLPGGAVEIIGDQITRIASKGSTTLGWAFFIGLATSLWSANAGMKALFDGLNVAYEVPETRGFIKLNLISMAFTLGGILGLLLSLGAVIVIPLLLSFVGFGTAAEIVISAGRWPLLLGLIIFAIAFLYRFGTSPHGARWRWITPGSAFAGVTWLVASLAFSYYAANFGTYNETYGSLGAVIGFMTWIWISAIVVLAGAELNGQIEGASYRKH
jgi:membrane protein